MASVALRRREFLASASIGVLALTACATTTPQAESWTQSGANPRIEVDTGGLQRMARLLYPHDALDDAVYREVVLDLLTSAVRSDPAALRTLTDGAASLDAAGPGRFIDRSEADQIAALQSIEGTPFFVAMYSGVQTRLYEHPAVWAMLGYPGPAIPFGGYVDKGFDDIDWLPAGDA